MKTVEKKMSAAAIRTKRIRVRISLALDENVRLVV